MDFPIIFDIEKIIQRYYNEKKYFCDELHKGLKQCVEHTHSTITFQNFILHDKFNLKHCLENNKYNDKYTVKFNNNNILSIVNLKRNFILENNCINIK